MAEAPLVLVVDDDERLRELYRVNLSHRGLRVVEAASGADALDCARATPPNVIVLDLSMPGSDGWTVLSALKDDANLAKVPIVVLTGQTDDDTEARVRSAGAVAYIGKPVDTEDLIRVVLRHA